MAKHSALSPAGLAHKVLGNRLLCLFIDDGLMRENEAREYDLTPKPPSTIEYI